MKLGGNKNVYKKVKLSFKVLLAAYENKKL